MKIETCNDNIDYYLEKISAIKKRKFRPSTDPEPESKIPCNKSNSKHNTED